MSNTVVLIRTLNPLRPTTLLLPKPWPSRCRRSIRAGPAGDDGAPPPATTPVTPTETVEIRFRRGSRRRSRVREEGDGGGAKEAEAAAAKKEWKEMSAAEKVVEMYVGEKGLLFWLNKFAYASIFAIIGGWIVFRFVGPALNLYQLDAPPLSPSSVFKGS
ncbi:uncharacterized protein LOC131152224 [Malania oleifera]|uniref:uncharacterized protein LOC131152224 n=1 Tax=Malania oleifera TaxID=397392 RepID=UPI0025AEC152|nr:uncharacterized protein LOC131152224 [Malania oleifera]